MKPKMIPAVDRGSRDRPVAFEASVALQAPRYSPNGEALHVAECDVAHASMTVGDCEDREPTVRCELGRFRGCFVHQFSSVCKGQVFKYA